MSYVELDPNVKFRTLLPFALYESENHAILFVDLQKDILCPSTIFLTLHLFSFRRSLWRSGLVSI